VVLAVIVLPVLFYICREVTHDALVIDPFTVPKSFEEAGLTSEVVANRIGNALRQIETTTQTRMKKDNLVSLRDEGSVPDVPIPGARIGLRTVVEAVRTVLGRYSKHVGGDIVMDANAGFQATVTFYITQGRNRSLAMSVVGTSLDIGSLVQGTAEKVLRQVNPYVLAAYREEHGKLEEAVEIVQRMVQDPSEDSTDTDIAAALNLWGNVLEDQKKYDEAAAKYQKAINIDPKLAPAYINWGVVLYDQNRYDEAAAKYQKAIKIDPKYAAAYNNWGSVFYRQGKLDEAGAKYQKATKIDPKYAFAYNNWGSVLYEQKKYDEAAAKYQKAIDLDPKYAVAYDNLGLVLYEQKKYDEAVAKYRTAIDLDPKYAGAHNNLGVVLDKQKKHDEAEKEFAKARELSSSK